MRTGIRWALPVALVASMLMVVGGPERVRAAADVDIVVLGGSGVISHDIGTFLESCTDGVVSRISGSNRYATAQEISKATHTSATTAYVGTGLSFPDALAAGSPAALDGAPILLTGPAALRWNVSSELARLGVSKIYLLGGPGAVSDDVKMALEMYGTTTRLAGSTRYETAAAVSAARFAAEDTHTAYIATGENFPDALAGGPAAAKDGAPILLVRADSIPHATAAELDRLELSTIVVLGGPGAVSSEVEGELAAYAGSVVRYSGSNRYRTAQKISQETFDPGVDAIYIATGENYPDALAGASAAGIAGGPILLVTRYSVPAATAEELERLTGAPCGGHQTTPFTFGDGVWEIGTQVPPGRYRNSESVNCLAQRLSGLGGTPEEVIAERQSTHEFVVDIEATDAGFSSNSCGFWTNDIVLKSGSTSAPFGGGIFFVNDEIAPGVWQNDNPERRRCRWERLSGFSWEPHHVIAQGGGKDPVQVTIESSDSGFFSNNCGTWTKIG